ncbi:16S rRNA (uracil(1498)-N(3))-methyltransferase [Halioxenophilus aromaticivorans]|uniref:Ribosomal RNA small subunit methyltransferase E n=1 Tax=Halioxenophilus aromaticivorans TaxID=1306992 RepID=A0AAV3TZB2_9ALTE
MNLLLLTSADLLSPTTAQVCDYRAEHLRKIHRSSVGDQLRVGVVNGSMGTATITSITDSAVTLDFDCSCSPPAPMPLTLVLALPRPQMLKRSLQTLATMGVKDVHLIGSARVEKSFWSSPMLNGEEINRQLILGLEQGIDTVLPSIEFHKRFKPFVEDILPTLCQGKNAWVAHPGNSTPCPRASVGPQLLVIGPEGGFLDYEVEKLTAAGCQQIQLGPRILRVETALPVLLSRFYPH